MPLQGSPDRHFILREPRAMQALELFKGVSLEPMTTYRPVSLESVVDIDFRDWTDGQR